MSPSPQSLPLHRLLDLSADAVQAVRDGRSLSDVLTGIEAKARPGVQALTFEAMRRLGTAAELLRLLAPKAPPQRVQALLQVALACLWPSERAAYRDATLVDQAVRAARRRSPAAAAFVNAVLRRYLREREALNAAALRSPAAVWNHPPWWIERLRRDWPAQWQALLQSGQAHPPMTLRVNRRAGSGAAYRDRLADSGRAATLLEDPAFGGQAIVLAEPCPVAQLPGFEHGAVSVQDASAQRAAQLLVAHAGLGRGARVLDACAAPGGKTAHLLELADLDVLALDSDARRLDKVADTLRRLRLQARLVAADARDTAAWWDGRPFDAVLLDAPCSASGIVRRHPDIRWLRRDGDIDALATLQKQLLDALWPTVRPGGWLLYATCSVFRCESERQIDAFLQRHGADGARLDPASPGQLLPLPDNGRMPEGAGAVHDGFFYALLQKEGPSRPSAA